MFNGGDECEPGLVMQEDESLSCILNYRLGEEDQPKIAVIKLTN